MKISIYMYICINYDIKVASCIFHTKYIEMLHNLINITGERTNYFIHIKVRTDTYNFKDT
jgi:hypothetical protein